MQTPPIVSPEEWEAARLRLLVEEKELTKARDAMAAARRRMPWTEVLYKPLTGLWAPLLGVHPAMGAVMGAIALMIGHWTM